MLYQLLHQLHHSNRQLYFRYFTYFSTIIVTITIEYHYIDPYLLLLPRPIGTAPAPALSLSLRILATVFVSSHIIAIVSNNQHLFTLVTHNEIADNAAYLAREVSVHVPY